MSPKSEDSYHRRGFLQPFGRHSLVDHPVLLALYHSNQLISSIPKHESSTSGPVLFNGMRVRDRSFERYETPLGMVSFSLEKNPEVSNLESTWWVQPLVVSRRMVSKFRHFGKFNAKWWLNDRLFDTPLDLPCVMVFGRQARGLMVWWWKWGASEACPVDVASRTSSTAMAKCRRSLCTRSSFDMRNFKHLRGQKMHEEIFQVHWVSQIMVPIRKDRFLTLLNRLIYQFNQVVWVRCVTCLKICLACRSWDWTNIADQSTSHTARDHVSPMRPTSEASETPPSTKQELLLCETPPGVLSQLALLNAR